MVTRTPVVEHHDDFVVVQRPHMYGYMTEYAGWFINRRRLIDFVLARGLRLERQFLIAEEAANHWYLGAGIGLSYTPVLERSKGAAVE